jgi:hypothetical protein
LALACGLLLQAGCKSNGQAWGEANSVIVVATDSLWRQVGDSVLKALEPRVLTVRSERSFNLTHVSPLDTNWLQLRRFRQVLALGVAEDSWVEPAVGDPPRPPPYIAEAEDVWANDQRLTAVVLSPARPAAEVLAALPALRARLDSAYRVYTRLRMYRSQANEALRDTLRATAGFALLLPRLYRMERRDSLIVFRNWTNVGGELRRTVAVTWRNGVDSSTSNQTLLAWRDTMTRWYGHAQSVEREPQRRRRISRGDLVGFEIQGAWKSDFDGVPAGGPFISRMIPCPDQGRTYLLDAWLYAPARQKYEYMIQLETLLNTFRCGSAPAPAPN